MALTFIIAAAAITALYLTELNNHGEQTSSVKERLTRDYSMLLFAVYPLIFSPVQKYYAIGTLKYYAWLVITVPFLGVMAAGEFKNAIFIRHKSVDNHISFERGNISLHKKLGDTGLINYFVILWMAFCIMAVLLSGDPVSSFLGPNGWYTGLLFQVLIAFLFILSSRYLSVTRRMIQLTLLSSGVIFLTAYLQRFGIDPLRLGANLLPEEHILFLSTIGQATWYSSFLCIIIPAGIYVFIFDENKGSRVGSAFFLTAAFGSLVTQNSDSAYIALLLTLTVFLCFSFITSKYLIRFSEVVVLIGGSFTLTGILQEQVPVSEVKLGTLSLFLTQSGISLLFIIAGMIVIILIKIFSGRKYNILVNSSERFPGKNMVYARCRRCLGAMLTVILVSAATVGVILYLTGRGLFSSSVGILNFNDGWGNNRGMIWRLAVRMYRDLPVYQKIFGIGPGMFHEHIQQYTGYVLMNAHNEWLNAFIEYGVAGGVCYLAIYVSTFLYILKHCDCQERMCLVPVMASILAYLGHQFFCYEQCVATPLIFTLMGLGVHIAHSYGKKSSDPMAKADAGTRNKWSLF